MGIDFLGFLGGLGRTRFFSWEGLILGVDQSVPTLRRSIVKVKFYITVKKTRFVSPPTILRFYWF